MSSIPKKVPYRKQSSVINFAFPTSYASIENWARRRQLSYTAARHRYLQFAVLDSVACDSKLSESLIFRGAGCLSLFYGGVREVKDLDFLLLNIETARSGNIGIDRARQRLNELLNQRLPEYFLGQPRWEEWLVGISIDLNACDHAVDCTPVALSASAEGRMLKILTIETIVSEKLSAIVQMGDPKKRRERDLFDLAWAIAAYPQLDRSSVKELTRQPFGRLEVKCSLDAFGPALHRWLIEQYDSVKADTGPAFIPFSMAWDRVTQFVAELAL